jgi:pantetheine-phosphate adenylyltransferase
MRLAVIPGSFDPVTLGHTDLIRRACALFDRVLVTAMVNPDKRYRLSDEQRLRLLRLAVAPFPNAEADLWRGMQWEYLRDRGACAAVKGIRSADDLRYELEIDAFNRAHGMETVFLPADSRYINLSSTEVRRRLDAGEPLTGCVTPEAETLLREIWIKERRTDGGDPN